MNILSLFDGISCGRLALERAGIKVDKYFASEIDPYAIKIAKKNYPDTIHIGNIIDVSYIDTPQGGILQTVPRIVRQSGEYPSYGVNIDMIIGGSPCQDLSIAKKDGKGLQGEKSSLFFEYVRLLKEVKPKYFLLENVASMKKSDKEEITRILTEIYPDVQCYLINSALVSAQNRKRLYWTNIQGVEQPEDKGILLKDILEDNVDEKYNVSEKHTVAMRESRNCKKLNIPDIDGKSSCITESYYKIPNDAPYIGTIRVGQFNSGGQGDRVYSPEGKSVSLSANGGGRGAKTGLYEVPPVIRKLTPIECERLQTIPDDYTSGVSNTQRYKAIGNGWTINVIAHIFSYIK